MDNRYKNMDNDQSDDSTTENDFLYKINLNHFSSVASKSQDVLPNGIFVAIQGSQTNGMEYAKEALANGASLIVYEEGNTFLNLNNNNHYDDNFSDQSHNSTPKYNKKHTHNMKSTFIESNFIEKHTVEAHNHQEMLDKSILNNENQNIVSYNPHYISVPNARKFLAFACRYYNKNQPKFMAAVTGTDGKTSTCHFAQQIFRYVQNDLKNLQDGQSICIGTLGIMINKIDSSDPLKFHQESIRLKSSLTTPSTSEFFSIINEFSYIPNCFFEASSIGIEQHRIDFAQIHVGVFTNCHEDHIDVHHSYENYLQAKMRLFRELILPNGFAILHESINNFEEISDICKSRNIHVIKYGESSDCDIKLIHRSLISKSESQIIIEIFGEKVIATTKITAKFQIHNAMAAIGILLSKLSLEQEYSTSNIVKNKNLLSAISNALSSLSNINGRMTEIENTNIFIDYAHTPNALKCALQELKSVYDKVILVFGCPGNRDKIKRPKMAKTALQYADVVIITDDNPRNEDAKSIRKEIMISNDFVEIEDRKKAIFYGVNVLYNIINSCNKKSTVAASLTQEKICLLIAGKGHEHEQIIGNQSMQFNDLDMAKEAIKSVQFNDLDMAKEAIKSVQFNDLDMAKEAIKSMQFNDLDMAKEAIKSMQFNDLDMAKEIYIDQDTLASKIIHTDNSINYTTPIWTENEIKLALNLDFLPKFRYKCTGISSDTRTISEGNIFIGLKGENYDGSSYAIEAIKNGASLVIIDQINQHKLSDIENIVYVENCHDALIKLAQFARARAKNTKIFGITGSAGKTTTKECIAYILQNMNLKIHYSIKSYNNQIGLPITLANMPIDCDIGIFEIGMNNPNEISYLSQILRPHISLVTNIFPVHMENFANVSDIFKEKLSIFDNTNELCIINFQDPALINVKNRAISALKYHSHNEIAKHFLNKWNNTILDNDQQIYQVINSKIKQLFLDKASNIEKKPSLMLLNYNNNSKDILSNIKNDISSEIYQAHDVFSKIFQVIDINLDKNILNIQTNDQKLEFKINQHKTNKSFEHNKIIGSIIAEILLASQENYQSKEIMNNQKYNIESKRVSKILEIGKNFAELTNRGNILHHNNFIIMNDTYNANPIAIIDSIKSLHKIIRSSFMQSEVELSKKSKNHKRSWSRRNENIIKSMCILGDMKELGQNSDFYHKIILELAISTSNYVLCIGSEMKKAYEATIDEIKQNKLKIANMANKINDNENSTIYNNNIINQNNAQLSNEEKIHTNTDASNLFFLSTQDEIIKTVSEISNKVSAASIVILVKGSHSMNMNGIVEKLTRLR